ncbi:tRNA (adenosine(37)-N6)-dimethylallyltransferase MiaA [Salmonirosea aquatica]|uniref:tRNA dimethylallyltransferase n=1 Tax=Salmonirosea aquatica TaxID=2654236 RepID=A0A7C9BUQ1_9BACT|nr:tRNA (adenosine(37)-N6)-dimethylallyltransferase MiaA [Cytophagaceae bacterium SJW1-29]
MIIILGPTASGKTRLAAQLAHRVDGEIISADSRQVYRGMTIGTGKDLQEYVVNGTTIPYHLIDIQDAGEKYHVHQFRQDVFQLLPEIRKRGKVPLLCGGTGLYIQALLQGHQFTEIPINEPLREELEALSHDELLVIFHEVPSAYSGLADTSTRKRTIRAIEIATYLCANPDYAFPEIAVPDFQVFGLNPPVEIRRQRISRRLHERLQNGLVDEVQGLLNRGILPEILIYYGLEYKFVTQYLFGELPYDTMVQRLETEIHRFAKRQMTYFRKMERDGIVIHWLDSHATTEQWVEAIVSHI